MYNTLITMYQDDYFNPANRNDCESVTTSECEWEEQQRRELELKIS